ncbi:hypothetical protein BASA50_002862 [Batrachochytrium salamandrivorans]|uniref:tRNA(His) guanylyltransferase n=1 Tax=Batrachochytrium salamandrivorans TaxID=1357716 RepID=A0ABQ8FK57_9FUNG|nr:hypothetical protein BASA60_008283 [Batrachochytrium salamandrivorans]KAH6576390.1 hypothetical protein BASA62_001439 [Batrachochytrium salamandrivorans]KAH6579520.1 hypothetical protein BASA61_010202 [Batrachochytrium salamandrivorans]KAH6599665.1 hypothetical protein BASA50_002862 [Batrachochytrium salamandrivorans]KAH9244411.1 hypothetical protein BASA81_018198 [Batrachochytrium salamandrivorans]
MAASRFEYVRLFEQSTALLRNTWIVVRIDGHGFHRFSKVHNFVKPNDSRSLKLLNHCAATVMQEFNDIVISYGQSDEFSFIFRPTTTLYGRREAKIITNVCSLFTSSFVMNWPTYFHDQPLAYPPSFDARAVCYPTMLNVRDYLSWRQADCHINNLYNTAFWALVLDSENPISETEAEAVLRVTDSAKKNELLFTRFGINYNDIDPLFRKGSTLFRQTKDSVEISSSSGKSVTRSRSEIKTDHMDIIGDQFWKDKSHLFE